MSAMEALQRGLEPICFVGEKSRGRIADRRVKPNDLAECSYASSLHDADSVARSSTRGKGQGCGRTPIVLEAVEGGPILKRATGTGRIGGW